MHPTSRIHNPTNLPRLQRERRMLKFLLHVPSFEESPNIRLSLAMNLLQPSQQQPFCCCYEEKNNLQIALLPRARTITLTRRQSPQTNLPTANLLLIPPQNLHRLLFTPPNLRLFPTTRPPAVAVFNQ